MDFARAWNIMQALSTLRLDAAISSAMAMTIRAFNPSSFCFFDLSRTAPSPHWLRGGPIATRNLTILFERKAVKQERKEFTAVEIRHLICT
jgi:hypothetical protein